MSWPGLGSGERGMYMRTRLGVSTAGCTSALPALLVLRTLAYASLSPPSSSAAPVVAPAPIASSSSSEIPTSASQTASAPANADSALGTDVQMAQLRNLIAGFSGKGAGGGGGYEGLPGPSSLPSLAPANPCSTQNTSSPTSSPPLSSPHSSPPPSPPLSPPSSPPKSPKRPNPCAPLSNLPNSVGASLLSTELSEQALWDRWWPGWGWRRRALKGLERFWRGFRSRRRKMRRRERGRWRLIEGGCRNKGMAAWVSNKSLRRQESYSLTIPKHARIKLLYTDLLVNATKLSHLSSFSPLETSTIVSPITSPVPSNKIVSPSSLSSSPIDPDPSNKSSINSPVASPLSSSKNSIARRVNSDSRSSLTLLSLRIVERGARRRSGEGGGVGKEAASGERGMGGRW